VMSYYLLHEIGPTRTSMVTYLFPLGGVLLGVVLLDEQLSWQLVAGAVLIILSLIVANMQSQKQKKNVKQVTTDS
jgi:drug/metabolite transporter (DMT)-like permease